MPYTSLLMTLLAAMPLPSIMSPSATGQTSPSCRSHPHFLFHSSFFAVAAASGHRIQYGVPRAAHMITWLSSSIHATMLLLCCAVLCCAVLCCAVLCCAMLCCAVLCCAVAVMVPLLRIALLVSSSCLAWCTCPFIIIRQKSSPVWTDENLFCWSKIAVRCTL